MSGPSPTLRLLNTVSVSLALCLLALAGWHMQNPEHFELFSVRDSLHLPQLSQAKLILAPLCLRLGLLRPPSSIPHARLWCRCSVHIVGVGYVEGRTCCRWRSPLWSEEPEVERRGRGKGGGKERLFSGAMMRMVLEACHRSSSVGKVDSCRYGRPRTVPWCRSMLTAARSQRGEGEGLFCFPTNWSDKPGYAGVRFAKGACADVCVF
jgi:hypothetical protein